MSEKLHDGGELYFGGFPKRPAAQGTAVVCSAEKQNKKQKAFKGARTKWRVSEFCMTADPVTAAHDPE